MVWEPSKSDSAKQVKTEEWRKRMRKWAGSLVLLSTLTGIVSTPAYAVPRKSIHSQSRSPKNRELNLKLLNATSKGDLAQMRRLLQLGADPDFKKTNSFEYPLLLIAAIHGGPEAVNLLLVNGADPNARDNRGTPILLSLVSLLGDGSRSTKGLMKSIELLLSVGRANPNLTDVAEIGDDRGALHMAAALGSLPLVRVLLRHGANVNQPNRFSETPIFYAAERGHAQVVQALIRAGAKIEVQSRFTRVTPLLAASAAGQAGVVRILLRKRANPRAQDAFGKSAVDLAQAALRRAPVRTRRNRYHETIRVLRRAGISPGNSRGKI